MMAADFRQQVFVAPEHWTLPCGLGYTVRPITGGGIALFSRPAFSGWTTQDEEARGAASVAIDDCGRVFWIRKGSCDLYRRDPVNGLVESMITLPDCDAGPHESRMIVARGRIWIADRTASRVIVVRPDIFEIARLIPIPSLVDIALPGQRLFSLSMDGIREHSLAGDVVAGPFNERIAWPLALGADAARRRLYVADYYTRGFLSFSSDDGSFQGVVGDFDQIAPGFVPSILVVDPDGNLFASDGSPVAHEFASDGGYVGPMGELSPIKEILGITVDRHGDIHVGSSSGIARFSREPGIAGNRGTFYTRTLDNGVEQGAGWQRVDLVADLEEGGTIDVYYASDAEPGLAAAVSNIFNRDQPTKDKQDALEALFVDRWIGPHQLGGASTSGAALATRAFGPAVTHSVAFEANTKRLLWLKLVFASLTPRARASVREMRVYYPRLSYLRYLPALYQQDPVSRDFLERFLSMFETVFGGIEETVNRVPETLDADRTPGEFLAWLAAWLDLAIEEDWDDGVKRELLKSAGQLYARKGTPGGLIGFLNIVTKGRAVIRESFVTERPFILGDGSLLGVDSHVSRTPTVDLPRSQRTILGEGSLLGASELRSVTRVRTDPFRSSAFRFTVFLDLPLATFRRYERGLHRIIRESAPAHVSYDIRLMPRGGAGLNTVLDGSFRITDSPPFLLGYSALGESITPPCSDGEQ